MKNYPNQASSFDRVRGTLAVADRLNAIDLDVSDDGVLGYAAAREGAYSFRGLRGASADALEARIRDEQSKPASSQGARTFGRELRRTLRDMGWLDENARVTPAGRRLLDSEQRSVEEQALLVEALLSIRARNAQGKPENRPVLTMLALLAKRPSMHRAGLELALEPLDDGPAETARVLSLYDMAFADRLKALGITEYQRANAVKIFPSLAEYAGLVLLEDGLYSLSQDGWKVLGLPHVDQPEEARAAIQRRRGRRTTVGRLVSVTTAAQRRASSPPRGLSIEEQQRAWNRLSERTTAHQALVRRVCRLIGLDRGPMFEDEFSYDLLWVPSDPLAGAYLFEMKTITGETDAYARVRHAVGQLEYYKYFNVSPTIEDRRIESIAAFDAPVPEPLVDFLSVLGIGALLSEPNAEPRALNDRGRSFLDLLQ